MTDARPGTRDLIDRSRTVFGDDGVPLWSARSGSNDLAASWRWLALLTVVAGGLRAAGLNGGLWYDEIITLMDSVRSPLFTIVTEFPGNNQHTLYSVLAHVSVSAFGEHPWSLRLPSLLFGTASVPVLFLLARRFASRAESLLACGLLTTAYHHVWFSQNARGYSALVFLTLASSWLLLRGLQRARPIDALWYGVVAAFAVYAHLTMVFLVLSHALLCAAAAVSCGAGHPIRSRWRFATLAFVLAGALTLVLYAPVLMDVKQFFVEQPNRDTPATPLWAARELIRGLRLGLGTGLGVIVAAVLCAGGAWSYFRQSPFIAGLFALPGVTTVTAAVLLGRPIFPRFVFFLVGFGLLIAVRGALEIGRLLGRGRIPLGPGLIVSMTIVSVAALIPNYRYPKQEFEGALRFVEQQRPALQPVAAVGLTTRIYRDFYQRDWPGVSTLDQFERLRATGQPVWILYTLEQYMEPDLLQTLKSVCVPAGVFKGTVGHGDVTVCVAPPTGRRGP